VNKENSDRKEIVRKSSESIARSESEILSRGLALINFGGGQRELTRDQRLELQEFGPRTLLFNCVPERGRMIAGRVSQKIHLRIVGESKVWREREWNQAVEMCRLLKPDLIMTCRHGFEPIKEIRKFDNNVAIVMITSWARLHEKAKKAGVNAFVPIPPDEEDLIAASKHAIVNREFAIFDSYNLIEKYARE